MFLSIVIPIWNDEKFLAECLDSCLTQDIPYDDYEIICVDDGSTDSTPKILADYAKRYPNVVIINKEHSKGSGRNVGMSHAKGEYIWFVDHDDLIEENCLAYLKSKIEETGCERLSFPYYAFYDEFTEEEKILLSEKRLPPENNDGVVWTSIISRAFLDRNNIWPHSLNLGNRVAGYGVDALFIIECREAGVIETVLTERTFYYYRKHAGQDTRNFSAAAINKRQLSQYNIALVYVDFAKKYRDRYFAEKEKSGRASDDSTQNMIMWTRNAAVTFERLPRKMFLKGVQVMKDKNLFWRRTPPEYKEIFSCRTCVKSKPTNSRIKSVFYYYSFIPAFLFAYKIFNFRRLTSKMKHNSKLLRVLYNVKNKLFRN